MLNQYLEADGLLHLPIANGVRLIRPEDVTPEDIEAVTQVLTPLPQAEQEQKEIKEIKEEQLNLF